MFRHLHKNILWLLLGLFVVCAIPAIAAPQQEPMLEVRGRLIDVRLAKAGEEAFPQYKRHRFGKSLPAAYIGKYYATSLKEFAGPTAVRAKRACKLRLAMSGAVPDASVWKSTGERFNINQDRFYIYEAAYNTPNEWMELPTAGEGGMTTMLFGCRLQVAETVPVPGVVVARIKKLRSGHITNPNILICKDGTYLAACSNANKRRGTEVYRSTDRGATWELWSEGYYPLNFFTLFEYQDRLYMLGTWSPAGHIVICESTDGGQTFSFPEDEFDRGVLFRGPYHSAPMPVVIHEGRIWRSMETNEPDATRCACVISAKEGSDLMKTSSWTMSRQLPSDKAWPTKCGGGEFRQWIEGCLVKTREGGLVNVMRVDEHTVGRTAAIITVESPRKVTFDPQTDIIEMPGGGKKFTIRYDAESDRYWALVTLADPASLRMKHGGIYANGIHAGLTRNTLTLISSKDLREWREERVVLQSDNPFFDGFQYVDWQFDGEDIVAVIRLAIEENRGLPTRQHDANFLSFYRVERFREAGPTEQVKTLNKN